MSRTTKVLVAHGLLSASLTLALPISQAWAGNYSASNEAELRQAILDANADPDPNATITLTADIPLVSTAAFTAPTKPITIDTNSFTLSGLDQTSGIATGGNAVAFTSGAITLVTSGTIRGGNGFAGANAGGGSGVSLTGGSSLTNNGIIRGGAGAGTGFAGRGASLNGGSHVNNGTISGGDGGRAGTAADAAQRASTVTFFG